MSYVDVYLTFADEAEAKAALFDGGAPRYPALEILGPAPMPISRATDADGGPVWAPVPGYHINAVSGEGLDLTALDAWRVYPVTPFAVRAVGTVVPNV